MKHLTLILIALLATIEVSAQIPGHDVPPRKDDHFQRQLVVNRIDLNEKLNRPIVAETDPSLYADADHGETNGLIVALFRGLQSGKYLAYDADSLNKSLTYEDVTALLEQINGNEETEWETDEPYDIDPETIVDLDLDEGDYDIFDEEANGGDSDQPELYPFETVVEFIEHRIFDKNRSAEVYDIQYIRLVWVDPGETLPDDNFVCFKFADVLDVLEDTQWQNRFNDAEHRNLREVFETRMFHGYITNVSGRGVRTLPEADHRRNQLLDFEHHLWSY